jgi:hypothetical protein
MKEDFLVNKIKKMLFESTDDIKVGDYFKLLSGYGTKYGKITKLNDNSTFPFECTVYIFYKGIETFLLLDRDLLGKEDLEKINKIDKSEFIETAKNFLEGDNIIIEIGDKKASLDDLIKVLPEFKEISSQTNNNNNNNNTETITASKTTQNQTTPTTTQKSTEKQNPKNAIKTCETEIVNFYNLYLNVYQGKQNLPRDRNDIEKKRKFVENCATENYRNFNKKTKQYIKSLMSVAPGTKQTIEFEDYFEINPVLLESRDIYSKDFSKTIKKVLGDHKQNKKDSKIEEMIIQNRFNFIVENTSLKDFKSKLLIETKDLISKGYDKNIVKNYYKRLIN